MQPSNRYVIMRPAISTAGSLPSELSSTGKMLIAKHADKLCDCLAAISAIPADESSSNALKGVLKELLTSGSRHVGGNGDDDADYFNQLAKRLSFKLSSLVEKSLSSQTIVVDLREEILFNLIDASLDSSTLEDFPSCNLRRIRENSSDEAAQHAWVLLNVAKNSTSNQQQPTLITELDASRRKRKKQNIDFWCFARAFGTVLQKSEFGTSDSASVAMGKAICDAVPDENSAEQISTLEPTSMEYEGLKRFKLLIKIFACASNSALVFSVCGFAPTEMPKVLPPKSESLGRIVCKSF